MGVETISCDHDHHKNGDVDAFIHADSIASFLEFFACNNKCYVFHVRNMKNNL